MTAPPVAPALREAIDNPQRIKGVGRHSPVAGLDRRSVGFVDVLAQSVSAVAPSAASTTVPVMVAATAGSTTVWAIGAAMLLCMIVASTVNQFARRISSTGSLYTFVAKGLGPAAGSVTGVAMLVGYGFIAMFSLTGASLYLTFLLGKFWPEAMSSGLVVSILIVAISGLCFVILARGIRLSTRVTLLVESVSVAIIIVLIIALLTVQPAGIDWSIITAEALRTGEVSLGDFMTGAVLAITAFVGFESAAALGVEARRPFATIPRAITWTVIVAGILYLLSSYSQLVGFSALNRDIVSSASPVNELAAAYGIEWVGILLDASIATSFFACAVASTTAMTRVMFSMGREGLLPSVFGRTSTPHRTPIVAIAIALPALAAVPLILIASGSGAWETMTLVIVGAAAGYIVAYILVCIAGPVFLWRLGELTIWPALRACGAAVILALVLGVYLVAEATSVQSAGVWLFLLFVGVGSAYTLITRRRKPWLRHRIGVHDETVIGDVLGGDRDQGMP